MSASSQDWELIKKTFQTLWGYEDFRPPQGEVIQTLLNQKDALIVMPTGSGKSICFQLPALLQNGLTLVISPLTALMENQLQELQAKNLPAALLHHQIPKEQRQQTLRAISQQTLRILYLSPETLFSPPLWEKLSKPEIKINGLILDEAHCLVSWGDSFRPTYRRLGTVRKSLLSNREKNTQISIAAFTATANPKTQGILEEVLELNNPQKFLISPYRNNLNLRVNIAWSARCRRHQLRDFIRDKNQQSGLVYARSRLDVENLVNWLRELGLNTQSYHAGLTSGERRERESQWLTGKLQFLVCTSAFGMGINKPDLRWVVHFQPPQLLSEYLQEIGRGGRDGKPAFALTIISEPTGWLDNGDRLWEKSWQSQLEKQYQQALQLVKNLPNQGKIEVIKREFPQAELSLALLHSLGKLTWLDPFTYSIIDRQFPVKFERFSLDMRGYLLTRHCRWQFLLTAFGFGAKGWRCGHCDNCQ